MLYYNTYNGSRLLEDFVKNLPLYLDHYSETRNSSDNGTSVPDRGTEDPVMDRVAKRHEKLLRLYPPSLEVTRPGAASRTVSKSVRDENGGKM